MNVIKELKYKDSNGTVQTARIGGLDPRIVIASETSSDKAKAAADFVFANDEHLLDNMQSAFNTLPETGGEIHLCAGTYDFSQMSASGEVQYYLTLQYNNIIVSGEGAATILRTHGLNTVYSFDMIYAENKSNIVVRDIQFQVGYNTITGVQFKNCTDATVENCVIDVIDCDAVCGIKIDGGENICILNNQIDCLEYDTGIYVTGGASNCIIENNFFSTNYEENTCLSLGSCSVLAVKNYFNVNGVNDAGIEASSGAHGKIVNNTFNASGESYSIKGITSGLGFNWDGSTNNWNMGV